MKTFFLYPGKLAAFKEETLITTLLGSCVAVALYDPTTKIGGLNHYLLPEPTHGENQSPRYGSYAIPTLIEELVKLGANPDKLQAKIYGGGNVINITHQIGEGIGRRNIELAEKTLKSMKIAIIDKNVGGESARTIKLNTLTFELTHSTSDGGTQVNSTVGAEAKAAAARATQSGAGAPLDITGFRPLSVMKNVKVLIVDDSATVRTLFTNIFTKAGLEVVGAATDPYQAREMLVSKKPDVITLDIEMPKMNGVQFLEKVMKHSPLPVVMVSSLGAQGEAAMKSLELGAIEFIHKPSQFDPAVLKDLALMLVDKVRAAASVNILKKLKETPQFIPPAETTTTSTTGFKKTAALQAVLIGGNAGSPESLEKLICSLASDTPPVIVACSTVANFIEAFQSKLKPKSKMFLQIAKNGDALSLGKVYFIPAGHQGKIQKNGTMLSLKVETAPPVCSQLPSANVLFQSAADTLGAGCYGVMLGGFGMDGVEGLTKIQDKGGMTAVQTPAQAAFPYAPQKAIELGVAAEILNVEDMSAHIFTYRNQSVSKAA